MGSGQLHIQGGLSYHQKRQTFHDSTLHLHRTNGTCRMNFWMAKCASLKPSFFTSQTCTLSSSKICPVLQVPCKCKVEQCKFLSMQKFVRTCVNRALVISRWCGLQYDIKKYFTECFSRSVLIIWLWSIFRWTCRTDLVKLWSRILGYSVHVHMSCDFEFVGHAAATRARSHYF